MDSMNKTVLTIAETAKLLRLGKSSIYDAVRRGDIPVVVIGRRLLVPRMALERLLEEGGRFRQNMLNSRKS